MHEITITGSPGTRVLIGRGVLSPASPDVLLPDRQARRAVGVVHQPTTTLLAEGVADALVSAGLRVSLFQVPDGDAAKTFSVVEQIALWLNDLQANRHDSVIAVGGGAVTDVAGFAAGIYLRGIEVVNIATTLLGAVDAAIGGKTGVNVGGKNLAGVFKHPAHVVIDLDVLDGLAGPLKAEGAAEAIKAGFVADMEITRLYEQHGLDAPLDEIVPRAVQVKADIVNQDYLEHGPRAHLNYGHTVGHAVEVAAGIPHGHAIAIGMMAAAAAAHHALGFRGSQRQRDAIAGLGLPVQAPPVDGMEIRRLMQLDKKRDEGGLRMVLLEDFERPTVIAVGPATVDAALSAVGIR